MSPSAENLSAEEQAIEFLARRSNRSIMFWASCFAIGGTILDDVFRDALDRTSPDSRSAFWIPFCFLVVPAIHYLARKLLALQNRITALEAALAITDSRTSPTASH